LFLEKIIFSCILNNTSDTEDLGVEIWLDNDKFFDSNVKQGDTSVQYEFDEDESDHILQIVLKNKTVDHTIIDSEGNILSDAVLSISDIQFDGTDIHQIFLDNSKYTHDFNGTQQETTENFFGTMGCNGVVKLEFSTPFYMWLLEHI